MFFERDLLRTCEAAREDFSVDTVFLDFSVLSHEGVRRGVQKVLEHLYTLDFTMVIISNSGMSQDTLKSLLKEKQLQEGCHYTHVWTAGSAMKKYLAKNYKCEIMCLGKCECEADGIRPVIPYYMDLKTFPSDTVFIGDPVDSCGNPINEFDRYWYGAINFLAKNASCLIAINEVKRGKSLGASDVIGRVDDMAKKLGRKLNVITFAMPSPCIITEFKAENPGIDFSKSLFVSTSYSKICSAMRQGMRTAKISSDLLSVQDFDKIDYAMPRIVTSKVSHGLLMHEIAGMEHL